MKKTKKSNTETKRNANESLLLVALEKKKHATERIYNLGRKLNCLSQSIQIKINENKALLVQVQGNDKRDFKHDRRN